MKELLGEWGLEILFLLISGAVVGYFKWKWNKLKNKLADAEKYRVEQDQKTVEENIEAYLDPIYEELEDLRKYIRDTENIEKSHMALIIASYRFRLVQLCKRILSQNYITAEQMEQLTEFYKVYEGLGGNGAAKTYYEKAINLPQKTSKDIDSSIMDK